MRLCLAALDALPAALARPRYDVAAAPVGIVHLGIGNFHRAHQAVYTDAAMALEGGAWGISGVSLRSPDVRDRMVPQDGLYIVVVERFANPALPHRTQQIAMDGSQKLPQRLLGTIRDNLAADRPVANAALAVAGWMRCASGTDEAGGIIEVSDPLAPEFARIARAHRGDPVALARGFLGLAAVFGKDLPADPRFVGPVATWLSTLFATGAARTVARAACAA